MNKDYETLNCSGSKELTVATVHRTVSSILCGDELEFYYKVGKLTPP
jgi:hypothetical protein